MQVLVAWQQSGAVWRRPSNAKLGGGGRQGRNMVDGDGRERGRGSPRVW